MPPPEIWQTERFRYLDMFDELIALQSKSGFIYQGDKCRVVFAPHLGARVFCELDGRRLHRLDLENVRKPDKTFNNYGGNNFWPAPEGGKFGFNYRGNEWYVQPAINHEPFAIQTRTPNRAKAVKQVVLHNRFGTDLEVIMQREFGIDRVPEPIRSLEPAASIAYTVTDSLDVRNDVTTEQALIACWTLEQFDASDQTIAFAKVGNPRQAINFDFYEHPQDRIRYGRDGFFYRVDGQKKGQIGIKEAAQAEYIGFYDLENKLLCIREIISQSGGLYFNMADNEQSQGAFSAADNFSIYNSDTDAGFFELETVSGAIVKNNQLKGSQMTSRTSFARFDNSGAIEQFIQYLR